ncbi:hypothetical protein VCHC56A2_2833, partial [Vibrio cholerae HC-56A2]
MRSKVCIDIKF